MKNISYLATSTLVLAIAWATVSRAGSENGSAGEMPSYYDGELFTINLMELPAGGEDANFNHNGSINVIYMADSSLPDGQPFISVIDAIQGDGFNPLWAEVQITFNSEPRQFFSDEEVLDAAESSEITLTLTDELYRCSVVGPKQR